MEISFLCAVYSLERTGHEWRDAQQLTPRACLHPAACPTPLKYKEGKLLGTLSEQISLKGSICAHSTTDPTLQTQLSDS